MPSKGNEIAATKSVAVVGCGGNIGSHLIPHLARMRGVVRVTLIDHGIYEEKDLAFQDIFPEDVGKPKANVQAARLRRYKQLCVDVLVERVQTVPLGRLRADVLLACLDSREARRYTNEAAWRLNMPWIDSGVDGPSLLARVNVYVPGIDSCCLECAWDKRHYAALEQEYPCRGMSEASAATEAPSGLGALAASMQAIECRNLLDGRNACAAIGREVMIDACHHAYTVTSLPRNAACRFDHRTWSTTSVPCKPADISLRDAVALHSPNGGNGNGGAFLCVGGASFVRSVTCPRGCGTVQIPLRLSRSSNEAHNKRACPHCKSVMAVSGFDVWDRLDVAAITDRDLKRSMRDLGFRGGDIFLFRNLDGSEMHYEFAHERQNI